LLQGVAVAADQAVAPVEEPGAQASQGPSAEISKLRATVACMDAAVG
jgi:hypothetical protein